MTGSSLTRRNIGDLGRMKHKDTAEVVSFES